MKTILTITTLYFFRLCTCYSQELQVNYSIDYMVVNGVEIPKQKLMQDELKFFIGTNKLICQMQVYSDANDTHSCGKITDVMHKRINYGSRVTTMYIFNWHFKNTYDSDSGIARVVYKEFLIANDIKEIHLSIQSEKKIILIKSIIDNSWKPLNKSINANRQNR